MATARETARNAQPTLDFGEPSKPTFSWRDFAGRFLRWLPVAALLSLLAQVGIRGLRPAMAERIDLERKSHELEERFSAALREQEQLELRLRAQNDPIYIERMRRLRLKEELAGTQQQ